MFGKPETFKPTALKSKLKNIKTR